jgi:hypothetical protein
MLNRVEPIWRLLKSVDLEVLIKSHLRRIMKFIGLGCFHVIDSEYFVHGLKV